MSADALAHAVTVSDRPMRASCTFTDSTCRGLCWRLLRPELPTALRDSVDTRSLTPRRSLPARRR